MTAKIHADEPDTSEDVARSLLNAHCPEWADAPISFLETSGTSNTMWRIQSSPGPDHVLRLPRTAGAAASLDTELVLLPELTASESRLPFATPVLAQAGEATPDFPFPWAVLEWLEGSDAWVTREDVARHDVRIANDCVAAVLAVRTLNDVTAPARVEGARGGPLRPVLEQLDRWLDDPTWNAANLVDVAAVRRSAAASLEVADSPVVHRFVHGDLIPGNILVNDARLSAIIDWGGAGFGDPAQDICPAWALFDSGARSVFRDGLEVDEAMWLRARAFELEHAVGGILYYAPKQNPLADVMARTLRRILNDK